MAKTLTNSQMLVKLMNELSNSTGFYAKDAGKYFLMLHRYLQNEAFKWMLDIIDALGNLSDTRMDPRNEYAVRCARVMVKALKENDLLFSKYRTEEDYRLSPEDLWAYEQAGYPSRKDIEKLFENNK